MQTGSTLCPGCLSGDLMETQDKQINPSNPEFYHPENGVIFRPSFYTSHYLFLKYVEYGANV